MELTFFFCFDEQPIFQKYRIDGGFSPLVKLVAMQQYNPINSFDGWTKEEGKLGTKCLACLVARLLLEGIHVEKRLSSFSV